MSKKPFYLVTNDDGLHAPGIQTLCSHLRADGAEVLLVAPASERSGYSQAISLMHSFKVHQVDSHTYAVEGTPVDCVVYALFHLLKEGRRPDWVVSGINRGANLGDDTLYSGTVGAALEAALHHIPALAISLVTEFGSQDEHLYDSAARMACQILKKPGMCAIAQGHVLNLNVPNLSLDRIKGVQTARLSRRHYDKHLLVDSQPSQESVCRYGIGPVGHDGLSGNDAFQIDHQYASLSLLKPSLFDEDAHRRLTEIWGELTE